MPSAMDQSTTEADWLVQLTQMQDAIAALKLHLPSPTLSSSSAATATAANQGQQEYGHDLNLSDEDFSSGLSSSASTDDHDDIFSHSDAGEDESYYSSGGSNNGGADDGDAAVFDIKWLDHMCRKHCSSRKATRHQNPAELSQLILDVLGGDSNSKNPANKTTSKNAIDDGNGLQSALTDILGYNDLDLVIQLIMHRQEIVASAKAGFGPPAVVAAPGGAEDVIMRLMTREQREEALRLADLEHKARPLGPSLVDKSENYPHIYRAYAAGNTMSSFGKKYTLPMGSTEIQEKDYLEIKIPRTEVGALGSNEKLVAINEMDNLCKKTFVGYKALNRMQSFVYPTAYKTNENMLICAPTGAGKTDAALLTILHAIGMNCTPRPSVVPDSESFSCQKDDFKIVYVAPMKALASEIVVKMGTRLAWLGIEVRELTGDMHLTKAEIVRTQIIVTTPEKWDVVTRKSIGDTELVQKVRLLILDEVHMLHDERGAVIESLVARTQRQVESTQSMIRIVGLSATLPNFVDVAEFLKVNPYKGLFFFDGSFRPVPLEQHFIGVKGKPGSRTASDNTDTATWDKVKEMLLQNHQVLVFVHSRKDTMKTAKMLYQKAMDDDSLEHLENRGHERYNSAAREMDRSKGREHRDLFSKGLGVHHAGMPRADRNLIERVFAQGVIKVLCCTATLAWGVNLPATAVVIKGTQIYNAQKGGFTDLGILDVLQIFGRAGRPQFREFGIGYIVTTGDKLAHYLTAVTQQIPIESRLRERIVDNLNAEIALGTVTTIAEAVQWLGYSYLFVRWKKNPLHYGTGWDEVANDPALVGRRKDLILEAVRRLQQTQMITFDSRTESLSSKDIGSIASNFYILNNSIEIFNTMMKPTSTEADILVMISLSAEFDNIQTRESDALELDKLKNNERACPCEIPKTKVAEKNQSVRVKESGPADAIPGSKSKRPVVDERCVITAHAKVNVLLQSHISRANVEDFALVSDTAYVAQNAGRICRALFLIALNRRWGNLCQVLLSLSKSIEKRIWSFEHPLAQFPLPIHIIQKLAEGDLTSSIESLRDMDVREISSLVNNQRMGPEIAKVLANFPTVNIEVEIAPLNRDVLRMKLWVTPEFSWNDRVHGTSEGFWIWVENSDTAEIYHSEYFILNRRKLHDDHELNFTIPLADPLPSQIYVRATSDRWLGAETVEPVSFQHLIRPDTEAVYTPLLNLQPLPITALKNSKLEAIYGAKFSYFNPMQTQIFYTLYHTSHNVLLGSPTGSGKTIACELAMWWAFREKPGSKVVYIAPMKALVRERVKDWNARLTRQMGLKLVELTGDNTPDTRTIRDADIIITTPEKWDGISRSWQTRSYVRKVSLVIIDEIHLLGGDRGPILEIIVSRMNYIASQSDSSVRLMGMSTACANATDLANWLGVKEGLYNFRHSVRPVPLEIYIDGFPEQTGFCPFMQSMNRPSFLAIKSHSPTKPVIIFVASRRQTRLTAKDLINFCGMEDNPRRFLGMDEDELQRIMYQIRDESLKESIQFGIGLHHAGLVESDREIVEKLFLENKIQVLVATATLAWGVNLPAHLVIVKGTQFYDAKVEGYRDMDLTDVLQMLGRAGRPQFDTSGIARIFTQDSKKSFYKYFLHSGFPVESSLHKVVADHLGAEVAAGTITTKQDALDYLTWTFFFRRLHKNPTYYGLNIPAEEQDSLSAQELANDFLVDIIDESMDELTHSGCIVSHSNGDVEPTPLGKVASYYYLSHKTMRTLLAHAKPDASFAEVLKWMSSATEYDELPVRHNEDLINIELSKVVSVPATGTFGAPMWDPHVKAFLLLQAFMMRIELPIADYVTDQNSVLDQAIRIMQAAIDVLAELDYLSSVMRMISLMQCIKQARWPTPGGLLSQLPGVTEMERLRQGGIPKTVAEIADMPPSGLQTLAQRLGVGQSQVNDFMRTATNSLPQLSLAITTTAMAAPARVLVTITRKNGCPNPSSRDRFRLHAPRFPKSQTEGMFVILGSRQRDKIYALKRVSWPATAATTATGRRHDSGTGSAGISVDVSLDLPPLLAKRLLDGEYGDDDDDGTDTDDDDEEEDGDQFGEATVWCISDGYIGVETSSPVRVDY